MSRRTGIVQDTRYMEHGAGFDHPESPKRLAAIYEMLALPEMAGKFIQIPVRPATTDELAMVHHCSYIYLVADTAGKPFTPLDPDTAGGMKVTTEGFAYLTRGLMNIADACCQGRCLSNWSWSCNLHDDKTRQHRRSCDKR